MLLKDVQKSYCSGNARACRTRRPICYTFGNYVLYFQLQRILILLFWHLLVLMDKIIVILHVNDLPVLCIVL